MIRLRRAAVIATFSLFAWAATASAECAWVLWWHDIAPIENWDIAQAHPNLKECTNDLIETARILKKNGYSINGAVPGNRTLPHTNGDDRQGYLKCLPDTLDPRGPKGK